MSRIEGYLTQQKLAALLQEIVHPRDWIGTERPVRAGLRFRWDMVCRLNGKLTAVEFDGDLHYCDANRIRADETKDSIAKEDGYDVVRVPYWVQLTSQTFPIYFGINTDIKQDFPHGFVEHKVLPASYCSLGIEKFRSELTVLPQNVRAEVAQSLETKAVRYGYRYVLPQGVQIEDISSVPA